MCDELADVLSDCRCRNYLETAGRTELFLQAIPPMVHRRGAYWRCWFVPIRLTTKCVFDCQFLVVPFLQIPGQSQRRNGGDDNHVDDQLEGFHGLHARKRNVIHQ